MGRPSEQIRCSDWTAAYILDDAALVFGTWVENEVKRYANHTPETPQGSKAKAKPPTAAQIVEYQRALIEGTPFRRIVAPLRRPTRRRIDDTTVSAESG